MNQRHRERFIWELETLPMDTQIIILQTFIRTGQLDTRDKEVVEWMLRNREDVMAIQETQTCEKSTR